MSTSRLLPSGEPERFDRARELEMEVERRVHERTKNLAQQIRELDEEVRARDRRIATLESSISNLQQALLPTYRGMQKLFGEIEDAIGSDPAPVGTVPGQSLSVWEAAKRQFPGKAAEFIDLLMTRPMNTTQLATTARCAPRTVTKVIFTLNKAGLIEKNGGVFSLKQI